MAKLFPCLWVKSEAEEALNYYASIIKNAKVEKAHRAGVVGPFSKGSVISIIAQLGGQRGLARNGNPQFPFTPAMSLVALCDDQKEIDTYWDKLGAGGQFMQCGWLTDKYGVAWQVAPRIFPELLSGDQATTDRVMNAMMGMVKLDIAGLQKAHNGQ